MNDTTVTDNTSVEGGGLFLASGDASVLDGLTIHRNSAVSGQVGGVFYNDLLTLLGVDLGTAGDVNTPNAVGSTAGGQQLFGVVTQDCTFAGGCVAP